MIHIDRISRHSRGVEGLQVSDLKVASLLFPDDVVLMAPLAVNQFAAECKAAGMRISTSRSSRQFEGGCRPPC